MASNDLGSLFPPVSQADADGLLAVGGELTPAWILAAYRRGIFPWPVAQLGGQLVTAWFSPPARGVFDLQAYHVPRRLARRIRSGKFSVSLDRQFTTVIERCAAPRRLASGQIDPETWITLELKRAYIHLHHMGYAHSVEVWQGRQLVGGLYGLAIGGYFSGESMFHHTYDASKIALVTLLEHLGQRGYQLFDIQQLSPHCAQLGARDVPRAKFLELLDQALELSVTFQ